MRRLLYDRANHGRAEPGSHGRKKDTEISNGQDRRVRKLSEEEIVDRIHEAVPERVGPEQHGAHVKHVDRQRRVLETPGG